MSNIEPTYNALAFVDDALAFMNATLEVPHNQHITFKHDNIHVTINVHDGAIRELRLVAPIDIDYNLRQLAYDLITTLLSETTNNDACDVTIRERSAHLGYHDDIPQDLDDVVVIDAKIEDELS